MLLDIHLLKEKYNLKINGVIHVGAHHGDEFSEYEKLNIKNVMFFEPVPSTFKILSERIGERAILVNKAAGNENKKIEMYISPQNGGGSSSILQPNLHLVQYPSIEFTGKQEVDMVRLDDYIQNHNDYNFMNIDVQGYELEVLKGSSNILNSIDYIMTEINRAELYKDCALVNELAEYLSKYGFKLVEENWEGDTWGDGFFIKQ